jgi:hypothetical protein
MYTSSKFINAGKRLRELDSGERLDPRDKVKASAARVGLSVPEVQYVDHQCPCIERN